MVTLCSGPPKRGGGCWRSQLYSVHAGRAVPVSLTWLLVILSACTGLAQRRSTVVPVTVLALDSSRLPSPAARALTELWARNLQAGRYELPDGGWDFKREFADLGAEVRSHPGIIFAAKDGAFLSAWRPVAGLGAGAFLARGRAGPIPILSVVPDQRPRRIVFVAENGKRMTPAGRKAESAVIADILAKAAPRDSFAFLTAGGPPAALRFGSSRAELLAAAEKLAGPPRRKVRGQSVLRAVHQAAHWLRPHQAGDSILVVATRLGSGDRSGRATRIDFRRVSAEVAAEGIRVFGMQLGPTSPPSQLPATFSCLDESIPFGCTYDLAPVTWAGLFTLSATSGGVTESVNTELKGYGVSPASLGTLAQKARALIRVVEAGYLLRLERPRHRVVIELSGSARPGAPWYIIRCLGRNTKLGCAP